MSACKRLLVVLLLCSVSAWAQRISPVWTAAVTDFNDQFVFLEFYRNGARHFAERYTIPANGMAGVRVIVRDEIKRLDAKDAVAVLVRGPVTPAPDVTPPPPLTDAELARMAFLAKVERLQRLKAVLGPANPDVVALEAEIALELKAHPEYEDSL